MNRIANSIKNRLSLRAPQAESLEILAGLGEKLTLQKNCDLAAELEKVQAQFPTCTDFERSFPSICFALATGVGKTRLMGAFITYLYLEKGMKNFFVLAPNLTIYNKLIDDFGNPAHPKYVFKGIGEFVHDPPRVITGENYLHASQIDAFSNSIQINVFNISKINAETRGGNIPRIKRLSEYLGESYFNYLSGLKDLVLLMDESHHYRADRGMEVINELNPVLGLEVTATPQVERASKTIKFKNVVYEYSLAKAIRDGFVKEPAVATRKNLVPAQFSPEELDRIKLEDGVRIHEDTKVALDIFARDTKTDKVKPFVLVVARDTNHASALRELIVSNAFFEGYYADKVMEIHSNQKGSEKEENIQNLILLEDPKNNIEIVIHVNMLKEGWDVTNLYTIIPLRTAASMTLREQTIGRGLRLPYGKRTGNPKVDKLTIVAHDRFQEIVDEANKPGSIIRIENIIVIDENELDQPKQVVVSHSRFAQILETEKQQIEQITEPKAKQQAQSRYEIKKTVYETLPELNRNVNSVDELTNEEVKVIAVNRIRDKIEAYGQKDLFTEEVLEEVAEAYDEVVEEFVQHIIEIPRITIQPSVQVESGFHHFELDTNNLNFQPGSEEIVIHTLRNGEIEVIESSDRKICYSSLENIIVSELMNYSEIDYDTQADLLFELATQAIEKFRSYLPEDKITNVILYHKRDIGKFIYAQMMEHFYYKKPDLEKLDVHSFTRIEPHNFTKYKADKIHDFRETITPATAIPGKVFSGFQKACHPLYKFDSKTEKDFAILLEQDKAVLKWLRPAPNQFHIYYNHNSQQYRPDFVVETAAGIFLVETKKEKEIESREVQEKALAALLFCTQATNFTQKHGGKSWKYVLLPHDAVQLNMGFENLAERFEFAV